MAKVAFIFGTRPEAIKLCPVILAFRDNSSLQSRVCVTAQHRAMLDQVLTVFGIVPDVDLDLMRYNKSLGSLTSHTVNALDGYLTDEQPDLVLIQGDTTTVFCAALAAFYHHIAVGHIEAGLRTGTKFSPFPEEINRVMASVVADLHFAPTELSRQNLLREGVPAERILVTGNTVVDALLFARSRVRSHPPAIAGLPAELETPRAERPLVLVTSHRRENFGAGLRSICRAIATLAKKFPTTDFVYPVHLNPNVHQPVHNLLNGRRNIHLIEPLSYLPFVALMDRASLILTDSGGVQEEAPSLGKPVLVMRESTERPEALEAGTVLLVGTDHEKIVAETTRLLTNRAAYEAMARAHNPYGDGKASDRIVAACQDFLAVKSFRIIKPRISSRLA
ncbi:MAG: UDP-N-acetylglucosamine 2-epimerase [candidate division Zixibacteria bacterium SM23_81]|nr:MAG: UDP-N-acetylglucosamine 2-epimerase [candidate division Zixibacteria bacterium SM23_81]